MIGDCPRPRLTCVLKSDDTGSVDCPQDRCCRLTCEWPETFGVLDPSLRLWTTFKPVSIVGCPRCLCIDNTPR